MAHVYTFSMAVVVEFCWNVVYMVEFKFQKIWLCETNGKYFPEVDYFVTIGWENVGVAFSIVLQFGINSN